MKPSTERIWELDALRGLFILCVIIIHATFDLRYFILQNYSYIPVLDEIQLYGGVVFVLLSGICVTLGSHSFRRGLIVFTCGMLITAVTLGMYLMGMVDADIIIFFGVLHLLGLCMMLYPLYKKLHFSVIGILGILFAALGYYFTTFNVTNPYLFPLGLTTVNFQAGDYFPIFPFLGWFMLGVFLGRTLYRKKTSLLPRFPKDNCIVRFFRFCGRHSLWIYLGHQPILYGIVLLIPPKV